MEKQELKEKSSVSDERLTTIFSATDLMKMDLPEPKWAVPNTISVGLTIFAGNPKMGKSWLALGLSISVASGGKALGTIPVEEGEVLYLALEDTKQRLQDRLQAISKGQALPEKLEFAIEWPRLDAGGLDMLAEWLEKHEKARLIIIDTLTKVRPPRKGGRDIYVEDYQHIGSLKKLADEHGVAIIVIHHNNKAGANDDPIQAVSGSFGLTGSADGILILTRDRGKQEANLLVTGRDVEEQEIALKWEEENSSWVTLGDAADFRLDTDQKKLIDLLGASEQPMSPKEVAPLIGKSEAATRQMMNRMARRGLIKSVSYGKYSTLSYSGHTSHTSTEPEEKEEKTADHDYQDVDTTSLLHKKPVLLSQLESAHANLNLPNDTVVSKSNSQFSFADDY